MSDVEMPAESNDHGSPGGAGPAGTPDQPRSDADVPTLGEEDALLRVLAFGGGGFNTANQLGVLHALLVIQGRAPDAVVGLSAGAINAVAVAEVLQAGEDLEKRVAARFDASGPGFDLWEELEPDARILLQQRRLEARVHRFRQLLDRLFDAPTELIDGLLPDAYQVDTHKPLKSVEAPIFLEAERERRDRAVANRAGLTKFYNRLLRIRVTFGAVTRAIRRALGISAAAEVRSSLGRLVVRVVELVRLWLLLGTNIAALSRVTQTVVASQLPSRMRTWTRTTGRDRSEGATAGDLIFRFRVFEKIGHSVLLFFFLAVLLAIWSSVSLALPVAPWLWATLIPAWPLGVAWTYVLATLVVVLLLAIGWSELKDFDRSTTGQVLRDAAIGSVISLVLVGAWVGVVLLGWAGVEILAYLAPDPRLSRLSWPLEIPGESFQRHVETVVKGLAGFGLVLIVAAIGLFRRRRPGSKRTRLRGILRRFLDTYRMQRSIFEPYALERFLAELFDPDYWGEREFDPVVEDSLADRLDPRQGKRAREDNAWGRRPISDFCRSDALEPVHVGLAVANLRSGSLEIVPDRVPVVSGLLAATAVVPFFPPRRICREWYVDGVNITHEPMEAVVDLLRDRVHDDLAVTHVYSVMSLPVSTEGLDRSPSDRRSDDGDRYTSLVEVARRAAQLRRFRDATLERRLTELYTRCMPAESGVLPTIDEEGELRRLLRIWVRPIEPDEPVDLNRQLFRCPPAEARRRVLETIADGCRAGLQSMVGPSLVEDVEKDEEVDCRQAVLKHLRARRAAADDGTSDRLAEIVWEEGEDAGLASLELPGADPDLGPGLGPVCQHCALRRTDDGPVAGKERKLRFTSEQLGAGLAWPHERERPRRAPEPAPDDDVHFDPIGTSGTGRAAKAMAELDRAESPDPRQIARPRSWPRRDESSGSADDLPREGPVRTALFSGGVFRGVFQMGAIAALSNVRMKPDLLGGASVGSITAAMTASVFASDDDDARNEQIAILAALYLALDRIVLTDRFADFIRTFTVRTAQASFSLRQADRVFRRFDSPSLRSFDADARTVFAGLERLFYLSPFEVIDLVKAIRHRDRDEISELLRSYAREWLNRMDVGMEVLGAGPLHMLVDEYVLPVVAPEQWRYPDQPSFDDVRETLGIQFLATTTNLTRGRLETLGLQPRVQWSGGGPGLREGLLASSAFPGVFRPREAYEVFPAWKRADQYVDGGIIDNLPLDAVAEFLLAASIRQDEAAEEQFEGPGIRIEGRPRDATDDAVPHLIFAASLEPRLDAQLDDDMDRMSWPELMRRARALSYNRKLASYRRTQQDLRAIYETTGNGGPPNDAMTPLDLEVLVAEPRWLCGTFAFHPMLGYRRDRQARSIAHGCATTMLRFAKAKAERPSWVAGWKVAADRLPEVGTLEDAFTRRSHRKPDRDGMCWLSSTSMGADTAVQCPFSLSATKDSGLGLDTRKELHEIFVRCHERRTHGLEKR